MLFDRLSIFAWEVVAFEWGMGRVLTENFARRDETKTLGLIVLPRPQHRPPARSHELPVTSGLIYPLLLRPSRASWRSREYSSYQSLATMDMNLRAPSCEHAPSFPAPWFPLGTRWRHWHPSVLASLFARQLVAVLEEGAIARSPLPSNVSSRFARLLPFLLRTDTCTLFIDPVQLC